MTAMMAETTVTIAAHLFHPLLAPVPDHVEAKTKLALTGDCYRKEITNVVRAIPRIQEVICQCSICALNQ